MGFLSRLFKKNENEIKRVEERNFFNIRIEDIITYNLEDYQVKGKLTYKDGGYEWIAYQLVGAIDTIWLSVEMDDELELGIYKTAKEKLTQPIPDKTNIDGVEYMLDEKGTAFVSGEGRGRNVNGQQVNYYDFSNADEDRFLSVEIWGSEVEVSVGWEIEDFEIKIIAAS